METLWSSPKTQTRATFIRRYRAITPVRAFECPEETSARFLFKIASSCWCAIGLRPVHPGLVRTRVPTDGSTDQSARLWHRPGEPTGLLHDVQQVLCPGFVGIQLKVVVVSQGQPIGGHPRRQRDNVGALTRRRHVRDRVNLGKERRDGMDPGKDLAADWSILSQILASAVVGRHFVVRQSEFSANPTEMNSYPGAIAAACLTKGVPGPPSFSCKLVASPAVKGSLAGRNPFLVPERL